MVGPMILLKMFHCRRTVQTSAAQPQEKSIDKAKNLFSRGTGHQTSQIITVTKKEKNEYICRVCLKEGSIAIYGNDETKDISEPLNTFGGIEVRIDDPHPKFLCKKCNSLLQDALLFRKTAQESDEILKNLPTDDITSFESSNESMEYSEDNIYLSSKNSNISRQLVYRCRRCQLKFKSHKELEDHKTSEEHKKKVVCPYCHKSYTPFYYIRHLTIHTKGASYVCDVCGKGFAIQQNFNAHRLIHFYKLPYKCTLCPYKGRFRHGLKIHMRSHTGERPYQCPECPSRFISNSNLNKHMLTHRDKPNFNCHTCSRKFYTKLQVEVHYKVDHAGGIDHVCKICGKAFGYRKLLMKHELQVHKRAKLRSGRTPIYMKVENMQQ